MLKKYIFLAILVSTSAEAGVITSVFDSSWTDFTTQPSSTVLPEDQTENFDYVYPGWGGQEFDAEYLFYKLDGNMLSVGLQTGFDIVNGSQTYGSSSRIYYTGDLALSFDGSTEKGNSSTYEYAVDFGFSTKDYYGGNLGQQNAGLYSVTDWNNKIYFDGAGGYGNSSSNTKDSSAPYSMSAGTELTTVGFNHSSGFETIGGQKSYYQIATFDISSLDITQMDAHWTMSCGNDAIDGHVSAVPEPSVLWLFSIGAIGLLASGISRRKSRQS